MKYDSNVTKKFMTINQALQIATLFKCSMIKIDRMAGSLLRHELFKKQRLVLPYSLKLLKDSNSN